MSIKTTDMSGSAKKELHIFYVLDTSVSMDGAPIGALNDAMRATVDELRKKDGEKADLRIAVMEYNSTVRWVTQGNNGVENLQDFFWTDLQANGLTFLGAALKELSTSLSRNEKMKSDTGNKIPVIIFMSDGYPNDDWEDGLRQLAENKWYRAATKIAFALGDHADTDVLAKTIGVKRDGSIVPEYEAVIKTNDLQVFSNMIQAVSVTASLAASTSQMVGSEVTASGIVKDVVGTEIGHDPNGAITVDTSTIDGGNIYGDPNDIVDIDEGFDDIY